MSVLVNDLRYAFRNLRKQAGFSLMIVGMLALGIAGTTAIFSIFNALFLRPLPFPDPDRLVDLDETAPKWNLEFVAVAYPDFHAWREHNRVFDGISVWRETNFNLSGRGAADRIAGLRVTHDLMSTLRIRPVLGRGILPEEDKPGGAKVAVLGYGVWQRMFGGKADVLGQTLELDAQTYTVVGVLPRDVLYPGRAEAWIPLGVSPSDSGGWFLNGVGRLKPGITLAQAREDLTRVHKGMIQTRQVNEITSPTVMPLRDRAVGNYRLVTRVLLGAVAVVLLIACVNIAGLVLARGAARSREMGIRAALGASRRRIIGQLLTESLVISAIGGVLGALLGYAGLRALVSLMPDNLPRWVRFDLDLRCLGFCLFVSVAAAVLFGLWPALDASRVDVRGALQDSTARSSSSAGKRRSLNALVVAEVALAVVLLIGAGLLIQAFRKLQKVDPGFRADHVLTYQVSLPGVKYQKPEQRIAFYRDLIGRHRSLPGVQYAAACTAPPLTGHWGNFFEAENAPPLRRDEQDPVVLLRVATPGYFQAIGINLVSGRAFNDSDGASEGSRVAIVNETFAKRFWPGVADPVGKRVRFRGSQNPWMTVIGLAHDVKHYGLDRDMRPGVYVPHAQQAVGGMTIVIRSSVDPETMVAPAREALRAADPDLPMFQVMTMSRRLHESLWVRRAYSWLLGVFAGLALVLAIAGIYGVISYTVSRRTHEIGIRMALGAQQTQVLRQVLGQGMLLAALGVVLGLAASFWAARLMQSLLFGVSGSDPLTYSIVAFVLLSVALLANLFPARKAADINPMIALRFE